VESTINHAAIGQNGHRYAASVVIPVCNEEALLEKLINDLQDRFSRLPLLIEFVICENGSRDATKNIGAHLAAKHQHVRLVSLERPAYGAAIRAGVVQSDSEFVVIFNADLYDLTFFIRALDLFEAGADLIIGSKCLRQSIDRRPLLRRAITASFNWLLRVGFRYTGTDTHGMKAIRRSRIIPIFERCRTEHEVFDTEFVLKAQRAGLKITELPVCVDDGRPARIALLRRVPSTLRDLATVWRTL